MRQKRWTRLDNASKIFMAAMTDTDTKVFRLSADLYDEVDPIILQQAVDIAYESFPLYHYVLRRGIFWYYLEESDLKPIVSEDLLPPCANLYHYDRKNLLFRVVYYGRRISLEVFHALSDGTGGIWFLEYILFHYIALRYPEAAHELKTPDEKGSLGQLLDNSFEKHFANIQEKSADATDIEAAIGGRAIPMRDIHRVRGIRTEDLRMKILEVTMPVEEVLKISKEMGVSLTVFLTALFMQSVYDQAPKKAKTTISASVPINLRQFFPSKSARNFFSTMLVSYTYPEDGEDLSTVAKSIKQQFESHMSREKLLVRQKQLVGYESQPWVKIIPRPIKNFVLKLINARSNRRITIATSNLGTVRYPMAMEQYIEQIHSMIVAVRPQFVCVTYKNRLSLSFTSPFVETEIQKNFVRYLTKRGVSVRVATNRVGSKHLKDIKKQEGMKDEEMQGL